MLDERPFVEKVFRARLCLGALTSRQPGLRQLFQERGLACSPHATQSKRLRIKKSCNTIAKRPFLSVKENNLFKSWREKDAQSISCAILRNSMV